MINKTKLFIYALVFAITIASCSEELELAPTIEYVENVSEVAFNGKQVTRVITSKLVMSPEGEALSVETVAITIDGLPMAQKRSGEWELNFELSRQNVSGGALASGPECETEVLLSIQSGFDTGLGFEIPVYCTQLVETTCYETYIEDGVMVTEVTYSTSVNEFLGIC